jgi:hypothetical protein
VIICGRRFKVLAWQLQLFLAYNTTTPHPLLLASHCPQVGWGATTGFQEGWAWDQAAATYVQDREMAERLKKANPKVGI